MGKEEDRAERIAKSQARLDELMRAMGNASDKKWKDFIGSLR